MSMSCWYRGSPCGLGCEVAAELPCGPGLKMAPDHILAPFCIIHFHSFCRYFTDVSTGPRIFSFLSFGIWSGRAHHCHDHLTRRGLLEPRVHRALLSGASAEANELKHVETP